MNAKRNRDMRLIEEALRYHRHEMSQDEIERLEWTLDSFTAPLLSGLFGAVLRGEHEVARVLVEAYCQEHPSPMPQETDCLIYCRVSTEAQTKGSGLERQLYACRRYAKAKGYRVVAVFSEVWTGAGDLYARGQAERMAKARGCKIICEDYDRWSRQGVEDLPPANVEMASESLKEFEEEMRKVFTPLQLHVLKGSLT